MAKTRMPRDDNSQSIPVLRFRTGGAQALSISDTAARSNAFSGGTRVITLTTTVAAHFETGGSSVTATTSSNYIPAGIPFDMALGADLSDTDGYHTHISIILASGSGTAYISEREQMVLSVSGLRLSLTSAGLEAGEGVETVIDFYNLLTAQNGDLLITQDDKQLLLNSQRFLLTQGEIFLTTEQDDFLLLN